MRNDDLAHSQRYRWLETAGNVGDPEGAADAASALMESAVWAVGESPNCECSPGPARHLNDGIWDNEATRDGGDKTSPTHESGKARAMTNGARDGREVKQRKVI